MTFADVDVRDVAGRPGSFRRLATTGSIELATEVAAVPDEVRVDLSLEGLAEGVFVSGSVSGAFALRCARCLEAFRRGFAIDVAEVVSLGPRHDPDVYVLEPRATLPLAAIVVDAVGLEMPFSPLCGNGCLGLCEVCGENRNLGACPGHEEVDPRWAGLGAALELMSD